MKKLIYLLVFCSFCLSSSYARWASFDDASIKASSFEEITVDGDGRSDSVKTIEVDILKEQGREFVANYTLTYEGDNQKITIIDAKTIYKGKEYKLDAKLIKDKALASSANGFNQFRQILLAFPKPEIGAKMYLKYRYVQKRAEIKGLFNALFVFGDDMLMEQKTIKLHSKLPLHIVINDPERALRIKKDKPDKFHNLEIKLTKPMYKAVIGEQDSNVLNKKRLTYVSIANLKKEEAVAKKLSAKGYDEVIAQSLPANFALIASDAAKEASEVDQINLVTSKLNDRVQYMTDARSVESRMMPRPLATTSKTQLGDCKDFAAVTAAILTKLGYKVQLAFVRRGVGDYAYPDTLPIWDNFNHLIVKVTDKHAVVRWIDPTNPVSMADGIFPDIAGKMALVIDSEKPSYERIPDVDPLHAQSIFNIEIEISRDGSIIETGHVIIKNELALGLTGAEMRATKKSIEDFIFSQEAGGDIEDKNKLSMRLSDLKSCIVKDIAIDYSYRQNNKLLKTNLGPALKQSYGLNFNAPAHYVQDILMSSHPFSVKKNYVIKNVMIKNIESLNKEIKSPWLYVKRNCSIKDHNLHIEYELIMYKNLIPNEAITSPEFLKLKSELKQNFGDVAMVLNQLAK